jgi:hypothetical protein
MRSDHGNKGQQLSLTIAPKTYWQSWDATKFPVIRKKVRRELTSEAGAAARLLSLEIHLDVW